MLELPPDDPAPLFRLFWENSRLTPARSLRMAESISVDAVQAGPATRPLHGPATHPLPDSTSPVSALWRERRSARHFGLDGLAASALSDLLSPLASHASTPNTPRRRLLPSGGAKYPVLTYAALLNVSGLPALTGHLCAYDPDRHGLAPLHRLPSWPTLADALGVDWTTPPAVVLIFVVQAEGSLTKYGERGGRFVLIETGSALAAVTLEATRQDLAAVPIGSFQDAALLSLCGLTSAQHGVGLAFACGPKPG